MQVNLDYGSEQDMVEKLRIGLAMQPIATALFANSPFKDGKPHGLLSYRSHVWCALPIPICNMPLYKPHGLLSYRSHVWCALPTPISETRSRTIPVSQFPACTPSVWRASKATSRITHHTTKQQTNKE
eukprot:4819886-Pyramimonas_sp.AAC.2